MRRAAAIAVVLAGLLGCGSDEVVQPTSPSAAEEARALDRHRDRELESRVERQTGRSVDEPDYSQRSRALSQMAIAFEGNPSQGEIQGSLDQALKLYGVPISEENYSRAGSALVALSNEMEVPEMSILKRAISVYAPGVRLSLPDAFGIAAYELSE